MFEFNLVAAKLGVDSWLSNLIYILVGLAALYSIVLLKPVTETLRSHTTTAHRL